MKGILESEEVFTAHATIDCAYYMLAEVNQDLSEKRSPLEEAIDKATGYGIELVDDAIENSIILMETIIENKKFIEADYSGDLKALNGVKKIRDERGKNKK